MAYTAIIVHHSAVVTTHDAFAPARMYREMEILRGVVMNLTFKVPTIVSSHEEKSV